MFLGVPWNIKADGDDAGGDLPGEDAARSDGRQWDESGLGAVLRGLGERIVVELHPHSTPSSSLAIHLHFCQLEWTRALPTAPGLRWARLGRGRCGWARKKTGAELRGLWCQCRSCIASCSSHPLRTASPSLLPSVPACTSSVIQDVFWRARMEEAVGGDMKCFCGEMWRIFFFFNNG